MHAPEIITNNEIEALRQAIDVYIETGEPVSSRMIKARFRLDTSTANIRKMLHRLEDAGLLYKPHTSAGRVPSDTGYRLYVDALGAVKPPGRRVLERLRARMSDDWADVRDVMLRTSRLLGELSTYMGLAVGVSRTGDAVQRIDIVRFEGRVALVILTLVPNRTRKAHIELAKEYPAHIIDQAARMINERIAGHPLENAPGRLESLLREAAGSEREIAEAVSSEAGYLFDRPYDIEYHFRGIEGAAEGRELNDPIVLQRLVRLMGERRLMLRILRERFDRATTITIGRENGLEELENFSLITHRFRAPDCDGLLGILGPKRMTYGFVLALLDATAEEFERFG